MFSRMRAAEQEHILLHDADLAAQRGLRHVARMSMPSMVIARPRSLVERAAAASRSSSCRRPTGPTKATVSPA